MAHWYVLEDSSLWYPSTVKIEITSLSRLLQLDRLPVLRTRGTAFVHGLN